MQCDAVIVQLMSPGIMKITTSFGANDHISEINRLFERIVLRHGTTNSHKKGQFDVAEVIA